ncbi:MAG: ankyrin repeat domain-containing protein [Bacteroidota bacterium]
MSGGDWKDMFYAVQRGDLELVNFHLRTGININYQHPEFGTTPLIESIRKGHLAIARLLLENGADPKAKEDYGGETALLVAEAKKNQEAIRLIQQYLV